MASLESLAADQRAVLQLVLGQDRSYEEIGRLLSIDRGAVRKRALEALDALGPRTPLRPERRALIADYLLGQLPARVSEEVCGRLAGVADERTWAGVIASKLAPLAGRPLPEIPGGESEGPAASPAASPEPERLLTPPAGAIPEPDVQPPRAETPEPAPVPRPGRAHSAPSTAPGYTGSEPQPAPREGGRGGVILLALGVVVAVVGVVVIIAVISDGGSSTVHSPVRPPAQTTSSVAPTPAGPVRRLINRFKLVSLTGGARAPVGIAEVLRIGSRYGLGLVAGNVPPNGPHNAYAVWLYNSTSDSALVGFVNPGVGVNGRLTATKVLPINPAARYRQLLVTLETVQPPRRPGRVILHGALRPG